MAFDLEGARAAGYTDDEIVAELVKRNQVEALSGTTGFDYSAARRAGYTDTEIAQETVKKPPTRPQEGSVTGGIKAAGTGFAKGLAAIPGFVGDMVELGGQGAQYASKKLFDHSLDFKNLIFPTTADVIGYMKKGGFQPYEPQTDAQRYIESAGSGAGSMAAGGIAGIIKRLLVGIGVGTAGQAGEDMAGPGGRLAGELIAGAVPFYKGTRKPNVIKALEDDVKDLGEPGLRQAEKVRRESAATLGTDVLLPQGSERLTSLSGTLAEIVKSPQGALVRRVLEKQAPVGQEKIDELIASLTKRGLDQGEANRVLGVGESAIKAPEAKRSAITQPLYDAANNVPIPPDVLKRDIPSAIEARTKDIGLGHTSDSGKAVARGVKAIEGAPKAGTLLDQFGNPIHKPVPTKEVATLKREASLKAHASGVKDNPMGGEVSKKMGHEAVAGELKDALRTANPAYAIADDKFADLSKRLVEPVQNRLGVTFSEKMRKLGMGDWEEFGKVLDSPRDVTKDIRFLAENLRRNDSTREAFPQIVKANWQAKWEGLKSPAAGRTPQAAVGEWTSEVFGAAGSDRRKNALAMVSEIAKSQGKDPVAAVQGAEKLVDSLQVISRDRGALGQIGAADMRRAAGENLPARGLKMMNVLAPTFTLGSALERSVHKRTYEKIAKAFTDPEGVDKLIEIARYSHRNQIETQVARSLMVLSGQDEVADK